MLFDFIILGAVPPRTDRHRLAGITYVDGVPGKRLVVVEHRTTFVLLTAKWSDPVTGAWEIKGLPEYPERALRVLGVDHTGNYNDEVATYVSQVTA
ncbi:MAG: hypothetical protein VR65_25425 [Desulfobulbaceae bacterium BRH_c16a]|nr:MAG: hypothetical protein VR65_25425 [Desulfobulbaceae bacterium BRH_c16a]